jgi:glucan-binding YG repeat protein
MTEKSIIGLKNNSEDSTEESVEENLLKTTKTKQKRSVGKKYFYEKTYLSLELAKKDIEKEESWFLTVKKNEKKTGQAKYYWYLYFTKNSQSSR